MTCLLFVRLNGRRLRLYGGQARHGEPVTGGQAAHTGSAYAGIYSGSPNPHVAFVGTPPPDYRMASQPLIPLPALIGSSGQIMTKGVPSFLQFTAFRSNRRPLARASDSRAMTFLSVPSPCRSRVRIEVFLVLSFWGWFWALNQQPANRLTLNWRSVSSQVHSRLSRAAVASASISSVEYLYEYSV